MSEQPPHTQTRLVSLDVLRGLDMLVIIGGAAIVRQLNIVYGGSFLGSLAHQLEHAEWHGFRFYDLIFPLFLFLSGASLPLSLERRMQAGAARKPLVLSALRRALVLVLLGVLYNGALSLDGSELRYASVLGRIGLAWFGAALAVIFLSRKGQLRLIVGILLGYWAMLAWVPVPGWGAGDLSPGHNLTDWIDQQLLPGRLYRGDRDPEGILGILPAVATAMMGACAGRVLMEKAPSHRWRAVKLIVAGILAVGLAAIWHRFLPINKNLWTSSFTLLCAGFSSWLLGITSYWLDGPKQHKWTLPLLVIGANSITAYLLHRFLNFEGLANALFLTRGLNELVGALVLQWLLLWMLYRRGWFLRV